MNSPGAAGGPDTSHSIKTISPPAGTNIVAGVLLLVLATIIFACQDAITKHLVASYPVTFILVIRYWFFGAFGLGLAARQPGLHIAFKSRRPLLQVARGVLLVLEIGLMALAYRTLGLAETMTLFMCYPLMATALAAVLLREPVGWRRWVSVAIGFVGIVIILRPGAGVIDIGAVYTLIAALIYAVYQILTRLCGNDDTPSTSFLYVSMVGAVMMTVVAPFAWTSITFTDGAWLGLLCAMSMTGHYSLIRALSIAPAGLLQPFNYLQLVWAVIVGWIVFRDMPDAWAFAGGALIVGSGLFVAYRERVRARAAARA
ncbi:drug/metabolite transporter (DMT)-like permease [Rhodobium orientis]|uniref:EamA domain-containing protein n=1 Tax=Rhodobium orientis TaxID=34017 RepID=A0A327JT92_9HYPH|nr:DMT family transporter [Rhodobium orientis]MBB4302927.1 drug/metabolite transporter (DMT)-like permease [Rhodobium orientis]MBK5949488.1 hypothetical protein [Rhodobium orientis]RAI29281.1 hypothetical protein CH339_03065 [Rhodobium orientis]